MHLIYNAISRIVCPNDNYMDSEHELFTRYACTPIKCKSRIQHTADATLNFFLFFFSEKIMLDISCESSDSIKMPSLIFLWNMHIETETKTYRLLQFVFSALRVRNDLTCCPRRPKTNTCASAQSDQTQYWELNIVIFRSTAYLFINCLDYMPNSFRQNDHTSNKVTRSKNLWRPSCTFTQTDQGIHFSPAWSLD